MSDTVEISVKSYNKLITTMIVMKNENNHIKSMLAAYKKRIAKSHENTCSEYEAYFSKKDHDNMNRLLKIDTYN
jgi:hypothetical protein